MGRQPPKLLSRVIRAIATLREQKGSSVPTIVTQVRYALGDSQTVPRNVTMLVRSALKHAVENGLLVQRAGKYRMVGRRKTVPVDSLEMAVDCKRKKKALKKNKNLSSRSGCKKRKSDHDYVEKRDSRTPQRRGRRQKQSSKSSKQQKSETTISNAASEKSASQHKQKQKQKQQPQQQRQVSPSASAKIKAPTKSTSKSASPDRANDDAGLQRDLRRETPFPDSSSEASAPAAGPAGQKKRGRPPRNRPPHQQPTRNQPDDPPDVEDEPMDVAPTLRLRSIPRNISPSRSPRRQSVPRQRENAKENDSLDDIHDHPPSYYD